MSALDSVYFHLINRLKRSCQERLKRSAGLRQSEITCALNMWETQEGDSGNTVEEK